MMDRNREARRAAAMTNGLPRRRHRTSTTGGSLRESPEDEGPVELQETAARLRDRTAKKDRDREMRERERDRLNRSKRRRSDKYDGVGGGGGGGGGDDGSSEDSVNDEEDEDEDGSGVGGGVRYVAPSSNNPVLVSSTSAASSTLTHRKSYPPLNKVFRVAPTWKAPDEMIGVSIPRKARSASTKRGHDNWSTAVATAAAGEQVNNNTITNRQATPFPGRSTTGVAQSQQQAAIAPSPLQAPPRPMSPSPSSSNVSIKKKIKANGPKHHHHYQQQQRPPKSTSKTTSSPSSVQDDIEIEVAEVLYGLMRQSQAPPSSKHDGGSGTTPNDSTKLDFRSNHNNDSKSRVSSPAPNSSSLHNLNHHHNINNNHPSTSSSSTPLTTVAPKRKRPRPYPEETPSNLGHRTNQKVETDQTPKVEAASPMAEKKNSEENGGEMVNRQEAQAEVEAEAVASTSAAANSGVQSDAKVEESPSNGVIRNGLMLRAKVEETSSSPNLESSHNQSVLDRVESSTTSTKQNSCHVEHENHREDKLEIDLMAPPPQSRGSPERGEEVAEYGGGDEKSMVTEREAGANPSTKPKDEVDEKAPKIRIGAGGGVGGVDLTAVEAEQPKLLPSLSSQSELNLNGKDKEKRSIDFHFDLEKSSVNEEKLNFPKQAPQAAPLSKTTRDDANTDTKHGGQSGSGQLPMSVPGGWHGGLAPMGYVGPLQGVVSMDGTPMASPPIQHASPHFLFSQPRPKRCATHCYIARNISIHQQMAKMNPFLSAAAVAAAGTGPLFGGKPPYNLNMVPSADMHTAAGRGVVVNSSQDNKGQPFTFFPGQPPSSSKDKSPLPTSNAPDSAQKKFLLQPGLPPGAPNNLMPGPALFFPMGQQQPAVANARPSTTKSPSSTGAASASASTSAPMSAVASNGGPAMSFSYPNLGGNETQFMAILGNPPYPFPIPAHVGAAPPYRGSHPQAMSFFNGSFYSSQMIHHPSQLQQQQAAQQQSQSMQMQQQTQPNASIATASSSSQKQLQNMQQQRPQGNSGNPSQGLQNFQVNKGRASQPHHEMGSEDSPSTADSRTRPNMSVYGQNFGMPPFHSPNFALMTPPSSMGCNAPGVPNGNAGDKKQPQQSQQTPAFPMSFATVNGATTPGLDMSSMAHNHAIIQSLPEAARQNYQLMTAAAAAHSQQNKKNSYRGPEDGKAGAAAATDPSNVDEDRKAVAARGSASVGQSIAFSRDLSENSMPGNNVVDTSARSLNLIQGSSTRPNRSSGQNTMSNSNASSNLQQMQQLQQQQQQLLQQQQQQQMLFTKQQQYVGSPAPGGRSKTPTTSNGNVYPDHLTSSSVMAAKFPNTLSSFPPLVQQTSGAPVQSSQWKNSVRPNTSQVSSPPRATSSNASNIKHLSQQQGRSQQAHTQISFGATAAANPKASSTAQGQQAQSNNQAPSSPMVVGSPSTSSVSKGASGSPRTTASASTGNKQGGQASTLSSQQGKNSQSPLLSSQKPSILGSPHHLMSNTNSGNKSQSQQSQQQPQLSRQSIQQAQLYFNNAYMQASANTSAAMGGGGYYLQRHRSDNQQQQQQQQQHGSKSQGMGSTPSSGMLSLCTPVSISNSNTSDPAKAVAAAAANMKGGMPSQGIFHAAQFAAQSAGGAHQLMPAGFPYVHAVSTAVQVKPAEQKQPAGE